MKTVIPKVIKLTISLTRLYLIINKDLGINVEEDEMVISFLDGKIMIKKH